MKKLLVLTLTALTLLTACGEKDQYADIRNLTVSDYLENVPLLEEILSKCSNREIKDEDICITVKKADIDRYSNSFGD